MPVHARASIELGLLVLVFDGVVTPEELEQRAAPLIDDPRYSLMPLLLVDMTTATRADGPGAIVREYARRVAHSVDAKVDTGARTAMVATTDEFFGLARMYEIHRDDSPVAFHVFRSRHEAERWLGLPDDYEQRLADVD